jgi:hypothetical protein
MEKENGEGHLAFPVFFAASLNERPEKLEADATANFDGARVVDLVVEHAPNLRRRSAQGRIAELVMVENVAEDGLEFQAETLIDVDVFANLEIDVPEGHAAEYACTARA